MKRWVSQESHNEGIVFRKVALNAVWGMVRAEEVVRRGQWLLHREMLWPGLEEGQQEGRRSGSEWTQHILLRKRR